MINHKSSRQYVLLFYQPSKVFVIFKPVKLSCPLKQIVSPRFSFIYQIPRVTFFPKNCPIVIQHGGELAWVATPPSSYQQRNLHILHPRLSLLISFCRIAPIRETSLIVFEQRVHTRVRTYTGTRVHVHEVGRGIFIGKQQSSGWRATVRVSDQLTICRQTRAGSSRQ